MSKGAKNVELSTVIFFSNKILGAIKKCVKNGLSSFDVKIQILIPKE